MRHCTVFILCKLLLQNALHVSGDMFTHHQDHELQTAPHVSGDMFTHHQEHELQTAPHVSGDMFTHHQEREQFAGNKNCTKSHLVG
jgi:hypothetical protein